MAKKKAFQVRWTIPMGNDMEGADRLARYKKAALLATQNPKLFNVWLRGVLDAESERILNQKP